MKRVFTLILILMLCACGNNKTITIKHIDTGYKKDLAHTIDLNNKYIITNASFENGVISVQMSTNDYEYLKPYYIDPSTFEEIKDYDPNYSYFKEKFDIVTLQTETYSIISKYTRTDKGLLTDIYYNDNEQMIKLLKFNENSIIKSGYPVHGYFDKESNKGYLIVCKESYFSINEINNGTLNEIKQISYIDGDYKFKELIENTNIFIFENNNQIRWVQDDEVIYVDKNIDGYELMNIDYIHGKVFVYNKNNEIRLIIDNQIYDLGYQADFVIREDIILSTKTIKENNSRESKLIDRNTNKEYLFDNYFILDEKHQILEDKFLLKNYSDHDNYYSILSIEDNKALAIDCMIPSNYEFIGSNEDYVVFMNRNLEKAEFYVISLTK